MSLNETYMRFNEMTHFFSWIKDSNSCWNPRLHRRESLGGEEGKTHEGCELGDAVIAVALMKDVSGGGGTALESAVWKTVSAPCPFLVDQQPRSGVGDVI